MDVNIGYQSRHDKKCIECRHNIDKGDIQVSATSVYEEGKRGATFMRHYECVHHNLIKNILTSGYTSMSGWEDIKKDDQDQIKTHFKAVESGEAKAKREKASINTKKPKAQKSRKKAESHPRKHDVTEEKERKKKDPNAPKKPLTAFLFFCEKNRNEVKKSHPELKGGPEMMKLLAEMWKSTDEKEKVSYTDMYNDDKKRYEKQMEEYKETGTYIKEDKQVQVEKRQAEAKEREKEKAREKSKEKKEKKNRKIEKVVAVTEEDEQPRTQNSDESDDIITAKSCKKTKKRSTYLNSKEDSKSKKEDITDEISEDEDIQIPNKNKNLNNEQEEEISDYDVDEILEEGKEKQEKKTRKLQDFISDDESEIELDMVPSNKKRKSMVIDEADVSDDSNDE